MSLSRALRAAVRGVHGQARLGAPAVHLTAADLVAWLRPIQQLALEQEGDPDVLQAGVVLSTVVACLMSTPVDRNTLAALARTAAVIAEYKIRDRSDPDGPDGPDG